jgi:hypothetical protein
MHWFDSIITRRSSLYSVRVRRRLPCSSAQSRFVFSTVSVVLFFLCRKLPLFCRRRLTTLNWSFRPNQRRELRPGHNADTAARTGEGGH